MWEVRKTYGHNLGFSCTFRQWKATSHCKFMHGYSLKFVVVFQGESLDHRNWLVDFGGLKPVKLFMEQTFDHKTLVAHDDPEQDKFFELHKAGVIDMISVQATGAEACAKMVFDWIRNNLGP